MREENYSRKGCRSCGRAFFTTIEGNQWVEVNHHQVVRFVDTGKLNPHTLKSTSWLCPECGDTLLKAIKVKVK